MAELLANVHLVTSTYVFPKFPMLSTLNAPPAKALQVVLQMQFYSEVFQPFLL